MLAEIEAIRHCPSCDRRVDAGWIICPTCRTRLNRVCPNCTKLVGLDWSLCAWCGKDFERPELVGVQAPVVRAPVRDALPEPSARRAVASIRTSVRASGAPAGAGPATARNTDPLAES
jgi:RNA polymerase subunit RPABC4/transcription elongation factor Spt4